MLPPAEHSQPVAYEQQPVPSSVTVAVEERAASTVVLPSPQLLESTTTIEEEESSSKASTATQHHVLLMDAQPAALHGDQVHDPLAVETTRPVEPSAAHPISSSGRGGRSCSEQRVPMEVEGEGGPCVLVGGLVFRVQPQQIRLL